MQDWTDVIFDKTYIYWYYDTETQTHTLCQTPATPLTKETFTGTIRVPNRQVMLPSPSLHSIRLSTKTFKVLSSNKKIKLCFDKNKLCLQRLKEQKKKEEKEDLYELQQQLELDLPGGFDSIPLLPDMLMNSFLLFCTEQCNYWLTLGACILVEQNKSIIRYIPIVQDTLASEYYTEDKKTCFHFDPFDNIFIARRFRFKEQEYTPDFNSEAYNEVKLSVKGHKIMVGRYNSKGEGGLVGEVPISKLNLLTGK
jgi:hypothetical protein